MSAATLIADVVPIKMKAGSPFNVFANPVYPTAGTIANGMQPATLPKRDEQTTGDYTQRTYIGNDQSVQTFTAAAIMGTCSIDTPLSVAAYVDSIGMGFEDSDAPNNELGWVGRALGMMKVPYVKIGRGGLSLANIVGFEGTDAATATVRLRELLKHLRVTHSLIQVSSNDITNGLLAVQVRTLLGKLIRQLGGTKIAVATMLPRIIGLPSSWNDKTLQTRIPAYPEIEAYNRIVGELGASGAITVIDAYTALAEPGTGAAYGYIRAEGVQMLPTGDSGAHPNKASAVRISTFDRVTSAFRSWLK